MGRRLPVLHLESRPISIVTLGTEPGQGRVDKPNCLTPRSGQIVSTLTSEDKVSARNLGIDSRPGQVVLARRTLRGVGFSLDQLQRPPLTALRSDVFPDG